MKNSQSINNDFLNMNDTNISNINVLQSQNSFELNFNNVLSLNEEMKSDEKSLKSDKSETEINDNIVHIDKTEDEEENNKKKQKIEKLSSVPSMFKCFICEDYCEEGVQLTCCNEIYCKKHIIEELMKNFICPSCRQDANMKNVIDNKKLRENIEWYKNLLSEPVISTHSLIKNFANIKEQNSSKEKPTTNNNIIPTNIQSTVTQNKPQVNVNQTTINNNKEIKVEEKKVESTTNENNTINPNIQPPKNLYPRYIVPNPNPNPSINPGMFQMMMPYWLGNFVPPQQIVNKENEKKSKSGSSKKSNSSDYYSSSSDSDNKSKHSHRKSDKSRSRSRDRSEHKSHRHKQHRSKDKEKSHRDKKKDKDRNKHKNRERDRDRDRDRDKSDKDKKKDRDKDRSKDKKRKKKINRIINNNIDFKNIF